MSLTGQGWEMHIQRLREERYGARARTVGTYQVYVDGQVLPGISGMCCESIGPSSTVPLSKRRVVAGRYALATQDGGKYRTIDYQPNRKAYPRAGIELLGLSPRSEILIHPGAGYLSSIGCINLARIMETEASMLDLDDSYDQVVALIDSLVTYCGADFPRRNGQAIPRAFVEIVELETVAPPANVLVDRPTPTDIVTPPVIVTPPSSDSPFPTLEELRKCVPRPRGDAARIYDLYVTAMLSAEGRRIFERFGIARSGQRMSHFLAQAAHETGGFTLLRESLTYTTVGAIRKAWNKRASRHSDGWIEANLLRNPVGLGDWAYGGRMGNRKGTSDGYDYRGGGIFQTTGRSAYRAKGKTAGVDLETHPDLIDNPIVSLLAACAEWNDFGGNALADADDLRRISRAVNLGDKNASNPSNGEKDRDKWRERFRPVVG